MKIKYSVICDVTRQANSQAILLMKGLLSICHLFSCGHIIKGPCILQVTRPRFICYWPSKIEDNCVFNLSRDHMVITSYNLLRMVKTKNKLKNFFKITENNF